MSNIDKRADSVSQIIANLKLKHGSGDNYAPIMRWDELLALLDELEAKEEQRANWFQMAEKLGADLGAAEKRIADQCGIIASARKFTSEYAGLGDVGAAEFIKIIDRAEAGKGEAS